MLIQEMQNPNYTYSYQRNDQISLNSNILTIPELRSAQQPSFQPLVNSDSWNSASGSISFYPQFFINSALQPSEPCSNEQFLMQHACPSTLLRDTQPESSNQLTFSGTSLSMLSNIRPGEAGTSLPVSQSSGKAELTVLEAKVNESGGSEAQSFKDGSTDYGMASAVARVSNFGEANLNPLTQETDCDTESLENVEIEKYIQKLKQLPRQWELTQFGVEYYSCQQLSHSTRQPVEFSIMTYNILSQDLLEYHPYLYTGSKSRLLDWRHRRCRLIAEITSHSPDILNLQEVHREHFFEYLKPRLEKLGYVGGYIKRTGNKNDGCATLWKKHKFRLLHTTPVNYCRGGLLDRDNVAVIVELQPIRGNVEPAVPSNETGDKVVIANTHVLFNPRRGDIKLAQLMILLAEIDKHAYVGPPRHTQHQLHLQETVRKGCYCPVIVTGDFNLEPQSELYKFLISGEMNFEGLLAGQISGQQEGTYGRRHQLERNFFSPLYGVTDSCQYYTIAISRLVKMHTPKPSEPSTPNEESSNDRFHSNLSRPSFNTGQLWHHLNLVSAYTHTVERLGKELEVTTHHNLGKCTVDYIFYSVNSKEVHFKHDKVQLKNIQEGNLKMIARYGLMSVRELDETGGIPNSVFPSDHLCLITKFLLK